MKVAVLGQHLEHFAGLVCKEHVVRHDDHCPSAGFEDRNDVLHEVELLVGGRDREVLAVRCLVRPLRPKRRVGQHNIEAPAVRVLVDRVAEFDRGFDIVQEQIHQRKPARAGDQFLPEVGTLPDPFCHVAVKRPALRLLQQPLVRADKEPAGTARGIADREVGILPGIGLHAPDNRLDQDTRREVLPGTLLPLACRLLQKPLERLPFHINVELRPLRLIDQADKPLQVHRVGEPGECTGKNIAEQPGLLPQCPEHIHIVIGKIRSGFCDQRLPVTRGRERNAPFIRHLDEQEVRDLLDIVPVIDPIVPEGMAEPP